jgi:hypothetical protein
LLQVVQQQGLDGPAALVALVGLVEQGGQVLEPFGGAGVGELERVLEPGRESLEFVRRMAARTVLPVRPAFSARLTRRK